MLKKSVKTLKSFTAGDKTELIEVLHPKNDGVELGYSLAQASLEVGESSLAHILEACSEVYYILRGSGRMVVGDAAEMVEPGDIVHVPKGARQYLENRGETRLEFLCIVSPAWFPEQDYLL